MFRFITLSEEKTSIEKDLKLKLNATNNTIYINQRIRKSPKGN